METSKQTRITHPCPVSTISTITATYSPCFQTQPAHRHLPHDHPHATSGTAAGCTLRTRTRSMMPRSAASRSISVGKPSLSRQSRMSSKQTGFVMRRYSGRSCGHGGRRVSPGHERLERVSAVRRACVRARAGRHLCAYLSDSTCGPVHLYIPTCRCRLVT